MLPTMEATGLLPLSVLAKSCGCITSSLKPISDTPVRHSQSLPRLSGKFQGVVPFLHTFSLSYPHSLWITWHFFLIFLKVFTFYTANWGRIGFAHLWWISFPHHPPNQEKLYHSFTRGLRCKQPLVSG